MPLNAMPTTQQAADMMRVSRPYLIGLLERGEIPFSLVGRHRRIRFDDLVEYIRRDDLARKEAADELTRMDQELGGE
jgi:excisionase family DNA binding protein